MRQFSLVCIVGVVGVSNVAVLATCVDIVTSCSSPGGSCAGTVTACPVAVPGSTWQVGVSTSPVPCVVYAPAYEFACDAAPPGYKPIISPAAPWASGPCKIGDKCCYHDGFSVITEGDKYDMPDTPCN